MDSPGIKYQTMDLDDLDERRVFIHPPGGILLELVIREHAKANHIENRVSFAHLQPRMPASRHRYQQMIAQSRAVSRR